MNCVQNVELEKRLLDAESQLYGLQQGSLYYNN